MNLLTNETAPQTSAGTVALGIYVVLLAFTAVLVLLSIPAGLYAVFSGKLSNSTNVGTIVHPYFWVGPLVSVIGLPVPLGVLFAFLTAVYSGLLLMGLFQSPRPWTAVSTSMKTGFSALGSSPFVVMMVSIAFLTFSASVIDAFTSSAGVPIGGPSGDPLQLFLGFTFAPLVEELGFRVVLIGIVALILSISRPLKDAVAALWRPSRALEGLALGSGASVIIWAATGFSAVTFGACHIICGGGAWDIGKFPEAAFGGLVLGYVYVKYGFHVAVITHWGVDFFGSALAFFGQAAYGIPWNSGTKEFFGQYLVDIDVLYLFGLASFLFVIYRGVKILSARRSAPEDEGFDKGATEGVVVVP